MYGLYLLCYANGQMHVYLITSSIKLISSTSCFAMYQFKSARMVSCWDLLDGGKPWHCRILTKLMTDQKFFKFSPSKFLYIYSKVSLEYQTNWRHSWNIPNNLQGIIDYPLDSHGLRIVWISHLQGNSSSAKGLSHIDWYSW